MERGNAKLYGIRFDLNHQASSASRSDCQWWLTPYAWLEKDDQWYLIKVFTPWIANLFPRFITKFPHKAWQVTPDEVLNNDIFRLHEYHNPHQDYAAAGSMGAAGGYSGIGVLPFGILGLFLPSNNQLSFWPAYLIYAVSILITCLIMLVIVKISSVFVHRSPKYPILNYPELKARIDDITETHLEKDINVLQIKAFNAGRFAKKIICIILFNALFIPFTYAIDHSSTAMDVMGGVLMGLCGFLLIFLLVFYKCSPLGD
ncbi:hypothetical protein [Fructilactobacillus florum]|uniref:hypothetical protein n=1 Tax=Fructilactobacillus florum TaxID=640331 RepID=UPI0006D06794|nr:hypothetical protein [Fructilactobacillus florum]